MAAPLISALPPDIELGGGYVIRVTAVSPTDGSTVTGVVVSNIAITAVDLGSSGGALDQLGPFMLVPGPNA